MILPVNRPTAVGKARIAAGNIWEAEYTVDGQAQTGLTAQLWVTDPDPALKKNRRVHPGAEFDVTGAHVRVVSVESSGVEVEVSPV